MQMPTIEPVVENVKYSDLKRYKYFGDCSKDVRINEKQPIFDSLSSIRSGNVELSEEK